MRNEEEKGRKGGKRKEGKEFLKADARERDNVGGGLLETRKFYEQHSFLSSTRVFLSESVV